MAYKILHLPTASFVLEAVLYGNGTLPILDFEVSEPTNTKYYRILIVDTKVKANKAISELISAITTKRKLYFDPQSYTKEQHTAAFIQYSKNKVFRVGLSVRPTLNSL